MSGRNRALSITGYVSFFLFCFLGSVYLTFPMDLVKPRILEEANRALNARKNPGTHGRPGTITVDEVKLWRLSGVELRNVVITDVATNPDPMPEWVVDSIKVRVGILALLRKQLDIHFDVEAYDGSAVGDVLIAGEKFDQLKRVEARASGLHWWKVAALQQALKVPGEGTLGGEVKLNTSKEIKEWGGDVRIGGEGLAIGPGEIAVPMFGSLTIPRIDLGKLTGESIKIADGKVSGPPITLAGKDVQGAIDMPLQLRLPVDQSQVVNGAASLKLADEFLKANPRFATPLEIAPAFKNAKTEDGTFRYRVRGALGNPQFNPDRNAKVGGK